jgi:ectoine hydroxylase-related dioxygenase (phytanoyl-CoA dioxygenase family)
MEQKQQDQLLEHGWCVIPEVLSRAEAKTVRERLWEAVKESQRRGRDTYIPGLDPNDRNVRVFNLLDLDRVFLDLIQHPIAVDVVRTLLGPDFIISNFTANIALPGSQSMRLHSDQSIVVPEPWFHPWAINVIWCLDDVDEENGATRFIPGSHKARWRAELPADASERTVPFQAEAGSIVAMDGRLWHTSGANVSVDRQRALLFGYYSSSFIRGQQNWNASLRPETVDTLSPQMREWLGLEERANVKLSVRARGTAQATDSSLGGDNPGLS